MLKQDRYSRIQGPAVITIGALVIFSKDGITYDPGIGTTDIPSDQFGTVDKFRSSLKPSLKFTPVGEVENPDLIYPHLSRAIGSSLTGGSDTEVLVQPVDTTENQIRFRSGFIDKSPDANLTVKGTVWGDMSIRLLRKNNYDVAASDSLFVEETNTLDLGALPFDPTKIIIQPYFAALVTPGGRSKLTFGADTSAFIAYNAAASDVATALNAGTAMTAAGGVTVTGDFVQGYLVRAVTAGTFGAITGAIFADAGGAVFPPGTTVHVEVITAGATSVHAVYLVTIAPWAGFASESGFKIAVNQSNKEIDSEITGTDDVVLDDISVTVTFKPQGISADNWQALGNTQGSNSLLGTKGSTIGNDLVLVGGNGGFFARVYKAAITKQPLAWKRGENRIGEIELTASRSIAAGGGFNPLVAFSTSAIPA